MSSIAKWVTIRCYFIRICTHLLYIGV